MAKQNKKQSANKPPTDEQLQGNQHDKIIKESIEETMHFLLKTFGNIDVVKSEQLPTDIQQTQERKPDFLKIITDSNGVERIGHIEFHVKDEADISYRAFETCAMMKRKKPHLGISQIIAFMGAKPAENIIQEWSDEHYTYKIKLIQFIKTPVELFLNAESAAEIAFGVLGDFGKQSPEIVISQLVDKIVEHTDNNLERLKFLEHLRIFSKLRNFEPLIKKIMDNIVGYFGLKDEDDYMYQRGAAKEREVAQKDLNQNRRFTAIVLLDLAQLTDAQIITAANISTEILHQIKKDLAVAPKKIDRLKDKLSAEQIAEQLNLPVNWVETYLEPSAI
jgi:hypothetical protein